MTRREQTKERNRAAILEAGRDVFAELGYGAATVRDIVRRTDLAAGTFYNHFPDKEAVFRALLEASATELRRRLREARRTSTSLEGFVADAYLAFFRFLAEDPVMFAVLRRNAGTIRALWDEPFLGAGVGELLDDLRAGIAAGDLPEHDADYMAAAMAGAGFEMGIRMTERRPVDPEGAARFASAVFLGGLERLGRGR